MEKLSISTLPSPFSFSNKVSRRPSSPCIFFSSTLSIPSPTIDADTFGRVSNKCNIIPLYRCIFADQLTPVTAYRCLVEEGDRESPSFLFDSFGQGYQASNVVSLITSDVFVLFF
ncbi:anthranilate synthase [Ranunculus cassubicifolius]